MRVQLEFEETHTHLLGRSAASRFPLETYSWSALLAARHLRTNWALPATKEAENGGLIEAAVDDE
jgi:hypothetical protein